MTNNSNKYVTKQILELQNKDLTELKVMWGDLFTTPPPNSTPNYLRSRVAYRLQELMFGGLSTKLEKNLDKMIKQIEPDNSKPNANKLMTGTKLIRNWQGERYEVEVVSGGFAYLGMRYRSLSAIAGKIVGHSRNGPEFFGLRSKS